jgi:hypothetical protein
MQRTLAQSQILRGAFDRLIDRVTRVRANARLSQKPTRRIERKVLRKSA